MRTFIGLIELALAIWVAYDASKLGARRGRLGGGLLDMGPVAWFFCCFLCFIVGFVCYVITRPKLEAVRDREQREYGRVSSQQLQSNQFGSFGGFGTPAQPAPLAPLPPQASAGPVTAVAGWYPDPGGSTATRWWDGRSWTEHLHQS